jgi:DNA-binding MarR family transcriptional regulator
VTARVTQASGERLSFLLARHGQVMNARLRQALSASGLSPRHAAVLLRLAHGGATSQQELIDALCIDASGLVALLNDLERDEVIVRRRDPADRRRHIVEITTRGTAVVCDVERAIGEVEREAFADLDAAEIARLQSLLARVRTRHSGDTGACGQL